VKVPPGVGTDGTRMIATEMAVMITGIEMRTTFLAFVGSRCEGNISEVGTKVGRLRLTLAAVSCFQSHEWYCVPMRQTVVYSLSF
jgi:hypothetical protein